MINHRDPVPEQPSNQHVRQEKRIEIRSGNDNVPAVGFFPTPQFSGNPKEIEKPRYPPIRSRRKCLVRQGTRRFFRRFPLAEDITKNNNLITGGQQTFADQFGFGIARIELKRVVLSHTKEEDILFHFCSNGF